MVWGFVRLLEKEMMYLFYKCLIPTNFDPNTFLFSCVVIVEIICHISSRYVLKGATFYSRNHYRGAVQRGAVWFYYDGLWERHQPGSGFRKGGRATPHGFILSSCIFVKALLL